MSQYMTPAELEAQYQQPLSLDGFTSLDGIVGSIIHANEHLLPPPHRVQMPRKEDRGMRHDLFVALLRRGLEPFFDEVTIISDTLESAHPDVICVKPKKKLEYGGVCYDGVQELSFVLHHAIPVVAPVLIEVKTGVSWRSSFFYHQLVDFERTLRRPCTKLLCVPDEVPMMYLVQGDQ